jgi:thioredoxin reductase (NADPH)
MMSHRVEAFAGGATLEQITVRDLEDDTVRVLDMAGAFVCIGVDPRSEIFADTLKIDDDHRIVVDLDMTTSSPLVFAAGVVRSQSPDQLITALADGVTAARSAFRSLQGAAA